MSKLTAEARRRLDDETFGLPGERKYPMPDRSHAANAKARAEQQYDKGNLSASEKERIDAKANRILHGDKKEHRKKLAAALRRG